MVCFRAMGAKGDSQMITFLCFGSVNRYLKREVNEKKKSAFPLRSFLLHLESPFVRT